MGPIGCPETSVRIYLDSLRNNAEERSSLLDSSTSRWNAAMDSRVCCNDTVFYKMR
jgi:hypothetical protein